MTSPDFFNNQKPKFPFDDKAIGDFNYEDEIDDQDDACPSCNKSLSEHTQQQRIKCALERIGGIPH